MRTIAIISTLLSAVFLSACSNSNSEEHECVDLGLSVKWATKNIGASSPEESGDYFAWGEAKPKFLSNFRDYDIDNYKWSEGDEYSKLTKYNTREKNGNVIDNKTVLDFSDDAAHENWGGSWRMPTSKEIKELIDQCKWEVTSVNGNKGYNITGPSGKSIFLPAAGAHSVAGVQDLLLNKDGWYWSSSLCSENDNQAYSLFISVVEEKYSSKYADILNEEKEVKLIESFRQDGFSIRPVCP